MYAVDTFFIKKLFLIMGFHSCAALEYWFWFLKGTE